MRAIVSWFSFLALTLAAAAQQAPGALVDPAELRALAANYELANAEGDRKCPIALSSRSRPDPASR
jgi:hypothetical protein